MSPARPRSPKTVSTPWSRKRRSTVTTRRSRSTGLLHLIEENLALPFTTSVLGADVAVVGIDLTDTDEIVAICTREGQRQRIKAARPAVAGAAARGRRVDRGVPPLGGLIAPASGRGPRDVRPSMGLPCRSCRGRLATRRVPAAAAARSKRCCADALEHPARVAKSHDAVGERIRAWAFEHHHDAIDAALAELVERAQGILSSAMATSS